MKSTKAGLRPSAPEDCGVWLDTVQLKQKTQKKKRPVRPIAKLLNPLAAGGGYSLAVALNFTQTKMEMPKTKQSSISTFFTAHRRVLNKMTTSEGPNLGSVERFTSQTAVTPPSSGRKRGRELCQENFDVFPAEPDVAHEWKSENAVENQASPWQMHTASHSPSSNTYCGSEGSDSEECEPPQNKKRLADFSYVGESQPPAQAWSQDPLLSWSQYADSESDVTGEKLTATQNSSSSEASFLNGLQSEEGFGNLMDAAGRTSTQKSSNRCHPSGIDDDKENSKNSPFVTNHKWTEYKHTSSQKLGDSLRKKCEKEETLDLQIKWTKPKSPLKRRAARPQSAGDENGLSALFTQDSQGFRVIAHRGQQARSPLRDQSNVKTQRSAVEDEEEDDMLFTQDSQGNLVIKH